MKRLQTQQQLLSTKPTSYRKRHVETFRVVVTEAAETDRLLCQEDLMRTRDTKMVFKHLKSLKKSRSLPKLVVFKSKTSLNVYDKYNMLIEIFQSVFSPKISFVIDEIEHENPNLTNFSLKNLCEKFFRP